MTRRVGPHDTDPALLDDIDEIVLNPGAGFIDLSKTSGGKHNMADSLCGAFSKGPGCIFCGENDDGQINSLRQSGDRSVNWKAENFPTFWIDQEELAGIAIGQNIFYYVVSRLVRSSGGPNDCDAGGFEKWTEFSSHCTAYDRRMPGRPENGKSVHRHDFSVWANLQRVYIDFEHVIVFDSNLPQSHKDLTQLIHVGSPFSPEGFDYLFSANFRHHISSIRKCQRGDAKRNVFENLRQYAADPEHDARSELSISEQAADDFPATFNHFLNQQGLTPWNLQKTLTFFSHFILCSEVKRHPCNLGLM